MPVKRPLVSVVDDDESVRESLPDLLREPGYDVEASCKPLEGVRMKAIPLFAAAIFAAAIAGTTETSAEERNIVQNVALETVRLPVEGKFPSLDGAVGWLNTQPLTRESLRGKVVLIDFWTYTCINWQRQLPYVRAWASKYKDQGLVVIGVHTPEFRFERDVDNVRAAVKALKVDYPVAIDSEYAIWRAFTNEYWPALYFIDAQGNIRRHRFGEGE